MKLIQICIVKGGEMKEIGIFKIDKNMCWNCREDENCPQKYSNGICLSGNKDIKIEQVPESFEDLKELCKDIKEVTITEEGHINIDLVYFTEDGEIYTYIEGVLTSSLSLPVAKNRTPAQMWEIIKSLIGEENEQR